MARKFLEIASTPSVLRAQAAAYGRARPMTSDRERDPLGDDEIAFIAARDSFYMATVSETGWPYVQHRGGTPGFLRVLDEQTIAFADYGGNRQLVSTGNLAAADRVALILMDYANRARLKILGHARTIAATDDPALVERVAEAAVRPQVERVVVIDVVAFDWNCPKHITQRFTIEEIRAYVESLTARIAELERERATHTGKGS
jgi:hypothetical protein